MFDPVLFALNGALCLAAFVFAGFVRPGDRAAAMTLAALLGFNFVFCALGYTQYAPKYGLAALGVSVTTKSLWMLADALLGCAAALALRWWGWALWSLALLQMFLHFGYLADWYSDLFYTDRLQDVLHAQIALFFVMGGPGLAAFLHRAPARLRRFFSVPATARAATADRQFEGGTE